MSRDFNQKYKGNSNMTKTKRKKRRATKTKPNKHFVELWKYSKKVTHWKRNPAEIN